MQSIPPTAPANPVPPGKACPTRGSENHPFGLNDRWRALLTCILLAAIVWIAFGQTLRYDFVNFDDGEFVTENPHVQGGLNWADIKWAFYNTEQAAYWAPVMWLSHQLACQFFGLNPWGHHLINILLHTANVVLVFLLLQRLTGAFWRSAFVAAVFAVHPLRVESVVWVTERKDVLSTFFGLLALWFYAGYARRPGGGSPKSGICYGLTLLFFALGLMSKPMLVTWPFVMLLLDWWPLERFKGQGSRFGVPGLIWEKVPFFGLSGAASVVTYLAQQHGGAMATIGGVSLGVRIGNALISYCRYIGKLFWPVKLAVFYPYPGPWPLAQVVLAAGVLIGIAVLGFILRRQYPFLLMGWLWYVGTLVPVIGLVQVGGVAMADRFTYVPQLGVCVILSWGVAELSAGWRHRRMLLGGGAAIILGVLVFCARQQAFYWRDNESLWIHTLACIPDNAKIRNNLGDTVLKKGRVDEAIAHFQRALQIDPNSAEAHNNLGNALIRKNNVDEAIVHFQKALQIKPDSLKVQNNLANALFQKGRVDEAIVWYQTVLQTKPDAVEVHNNLGNALLQEGKVDEAIAQYRLALQIEPDNANGRNNLNFTSVLKRKVAEAFAGCQKNLQDRPDSPDALNNLAWLLATCPDASRRDGAQAVKYAERACELTHHRVAPIVGTLAAAYAEAGRFEDAITAAEQACAMAEKSGEPDLLKRNQELLMLYRSHKPYHEAGEQFVPAPPRP